MINYSATHMNLKKMIGKVYLWLGLSSGLVVFILGVIGCIWAFEEELQNRIYADQKFVKTDEFDEVLQVSKSMEAAQRTIGEDCPIQLVYIKNCRECSYYFQHYSSSENVDGIWYWDEIKSYKGVYMNPFTAEVLAAEDKTFEFFEFVLKLRWSLLLVNDIGQPIVGTATIIFIIMLITGLILLVAQKAKERHPTQYMVPMEKNDSLEA